MCEIPETCEKCLHVLPDDTGWKNCEASTVKQIQVPDIEPDDPQSLPTPCEDDSVMVPGEDCVFRVIAKLAEKVTA